MIFLAFRSFFTVWLGMVKLSQATVNGSLNSQDMISFTITTGSLNSRTWLGFLNSQDLISQVNMYVVDIVWILCNGYVWRLKFRVL